LEIFKLLFLGPNSQLKILAFGGEICPTTDLLKCWKHPSNSTRIFNIYGVTEVSSWSACQEINLKSHSAIFLGEPLPFNHLQVRSMKDGTVLEEGEGQLFISMYFWFHCHVCI